MLVLFASLSGARGMARRSIEARGGMPVYAVNSVACASFSRVRSRAKTAETHARSESTAGRHASDMRSMVPRLRRPACRFRGSQAVGDRGKAARDHATWVRWCIRTTVFLSGGPGFHSLIQRAAQCRFVELPASAKRFSNPESRTVIYPAISVSSISISPEAGQEGRGVSLNEFFKALFDCAVFILKDIVFIEDLTL